MSKTQRDPSEYAQCHHQKCLYGVYDEHEVEGVGFLHAIEDEHRLHGKVPGTGTVGRRHNHGDAAYDESYQCTRQPQTGCGIKAEECQVVVQEVAAPDGEGVEDEQRDVAHVLQ